MILYFRDRDRKMHQVAQLDDSLTDKQAVDTAITEIQKYRRESGNIVYVYARVWNELCEGVMMTKFDVGSYSEFFYLDRQIDIASLRAPAEES